MCLRFGASHVAARSHTRVDSHQRRPRPLAPPAAQGEGATPAERERARRMVEGAVMALQLEHEGVSFREVSDANAAAEHIAGAARAVAEQPYKPEVRALLFC